MKALIALLLLLSSCAAPRFVVTDKKPTGTEGNCILTLHPVNHRAETRFSYVKTAFVDCWDYNLLDTIKLTRREFTNY